ncbi:MAG: hypothetical protein MUF54_14675, partial [Polyangiaceae bacterium]|nr:hypothetical protein [Polyangiaceae bacterium]
MRDSLRHGRMSRWRLWWLLAWAAIGLLSPGAASAQTVGAPPAAVAQAASAGASHNGAAAAKAAPVEPTDEQLVRIVEATKCVAAFAEDSLDVHIDPRDLFSVALDDERAVQLEVRRLERIVAGPADMDGGVPDGGQSGAASATNKKVRAKPASAPEAGPEASQQAGGPDAALWKAQLALDAARLRFLRLPRDSRQAIVAAHAQRQKQAAEADEQRAISDAQRKAAEAAEARREALEAVKRAQTEALRLVAEQRVRLLGVREQQAQYETQLVREEASLGALSEVALGWRRRVSELVEARKRRDATPEQADPLYAELIALLRNQARRDLSAALASLASGSSAVPGPGPEELDTAGAQVDRGDVDALRADLDTQQRRLRERETQVRRRMAAVLLEQVESLNRDRLELYPYLSSARRSDLTDFSPSGIDQARAEVTQVALVTRYHLLTAARWLLDIKDGGPTGVGGFLATLSVIKLLALLLTFLIWRRRAVPWIERWQQRTQELRSHPRSAAIRFVARALELVPRIRSSLEWLLLLWLALWIAGPRVAKLLEVRIAWLLLSWTLGGVLVVNLIDALFADRKKLSAGGTDTAALRLRSLRLLGRVVVTIGLTLALSAELVGKGTIYAWVLGTCWLAAIPVGLVIVRWWRSVIFERLALRKKKSRFAQHVLARQTGWTSFPAAALGGAYLIGYGAARGARGYVSGLNVTRRALAFW